MNNMESSNENNENQGHKKHTSWELHLEFKKLLNHIVTLLLKTILSTCFIFVVLSVLFTISSDTANVTVEINTIPNNWLVTTFSEVKDDDTAVTGALRSRVRSNQLTLTSGQACTIFATDNPNGGFINSVGAFTIGDDTYTNAHIMIEAPSYAELIDTYLVFHNSQPTVKISSINEANSFAEFDLLIGLSGTSVEQHLSVDFDSYNWEFLSIGEPNLYEDPTITGETIITTDIDVHLSFVDCNAYIVTDSETIPVTECEFHSFSSPYVLVVVNENEFDERYTKLSVPRESSFSASSSSFSSMVVYGVGKLVLLYTPNGIEYPLSDQKVELEHNYAKLEKDNIYTFEHSYDNHEYLEKNIFRLNASVSEATIAGESVMPNFRTWFRNIILNEPQILVTLILGQLALFAFIDFRNHNNKSGKSEDPPGNSERNPNVSEAENS